MKKAEFAIWGQGVWTISPGVPAAPRLLVADPPCRKGLLRGKAKPCPLNNTLQTILLLLTLLLPCTRAFAADPIVVGMSGAMTGPSRSLGIEIYRGMVSYFNYINSRGGIYGRKIFIKAYDDGYSSKRAIKNVIRLIEDDKVFALISLTGTEPVTRVLPLLKIYEKTGTLLFFPSTGALSPRDPPYNSFVVSYRPTYADEAAAIVNEFLSIGRTKVAIFYQADAYGRSGWYGVKQALKMHNLSITAEVSHKKGLDFNTDMSKQVAYLRSFNPDVVISVGAYEPAAAFIRDARRAGWNVPIARLSVVSDTFVELINSASRVLSKSDSFNISQNIINTQIYPHYDETSIPLIEEYRTVFDRYSQLAPKDIMGKDYRPLSYNYTAIEGYVNAKIFVEILQALGPRLQKEKLPETLSRFNRIEIGLGKALDDDLSIHKNIGKVYFTTVENGKLVPLKDFSIWKK